MSLSSLLSYARMTPLVAALIACQVVAPCRAASLFSVTPGNQRINELNPDTGELVNSFRAPDIANEGSGLAFSGTELFFCSYNRPNIWRLDAKTGAVLGSFTAPPHDPTVGGNGIDALAFGRSTFGPTLFALEWGVRAKIHMMHPTTGAIFISYRLPSSLSPTRDSPGFLKPVGGMDFNALAGTLFVCDSSGQNPTWFIREIDPQTGQILKTLDLRPESRSLPGLGLVGDRLFTSYSGPTVIEERDPATGAVIRSFPSPGGNATALAGSPVPEPTAAQIGAIAAAILFRRWVPRRIQSLPQPQWLAA